MLIPRELYTLFEGKKCREIREKYNIPNNINIEYENNTIRLIGQEDIIIEIYHRIKAQRNISRATGIPPWEAYGVELRNESVWDVSK